MIDTTLAGLMWVQARLPVDTYVNAIWDARYPEYANGNDPKAKGEWPSPRVLSARKLMSALKAGEAAAKIPRGEPPVPDYDGSSTKTMLTLRGRITELR